MRRLIAPLLAVLMGTPLYANQTYGLVIGIDDYTYLTDLHGAINDARDIADALTGLDAEVTLLLDGQATRAAVLGAWEDIIAKTQPGDRLIVTYAGHGSNEPEHTVGNEIDGKDENFLLAGFAPRGAAAGERIIDDEIAALIARTPEVDVIFVADACHAGTVTRKLSPTLGYRYVSPTTFASDPLPPPPPPPSLVANPNDVALFLAAVHETEKAPEYLIDGKARGALSFAFAQALRGHADTNRDLILTKGELETHVRRTVRQISDGVQLPQSLPVGGVDTPLFALQGAPSGTLQPFRLAFDDLPAIGVAGAAAWGPLEGAQSNTPIPDLTMHNNTLFSMVGDPIVTVLTTTQLQAAIDKYRFVKGITARLSTAPTIGFAQGNGRYPSGDTLTIEVSDRTHPYVTLFNVASDGKMDLLYPKTALGDPATYPPHRALTLTVQVTPPYGADHVVAIETPQAPMRLRAALAAHVGSRDTARLWDILRATPDAQIAMFPFFSEGQ